MGGISQSLLSGPNQTTPLGSQPTAPLQPGLDPTQRLFRSFNPNSSNPYGEVNTGRTNYAGSPGFISAGGVAVPQVVVPQSSNSDDGDDLLKKMMADAQKSTVPSSGYTSKNPTDVSYTGNTPGQMSNTSYTPTSGGGADGVGKLGAVGDFFGGIGDAIGVTNYAAEAAKPAAKQRADREKSSGTSGGK